ncbi:hypothetical protein [Paenibacillus sp. UNC499MF]|uniref:hypothetical protein n=1 Tax=Paenibacillus sp. UNC499MF TaxID=1502751 RepID=UPI0011B0D1D1|nr:hypothetical protein [Paenibacillus sp. UNC499MF]
MTKNNSLYYVLPNFKETVTILVFPLVSRSAGLQDLFEACTVYKLEKDAVLDEFDHLKHPEKGTPFGEIGFFLKRQVVDEIRSLTGNRKE